MLKNASDIDNPKKRAIDVLKAIRDAEKAFNTALFEIKKHDSFPAIRFETYKNANQSIGICFTGVDGDPFVVELAKLMRQQYCK